MYYRRVTTIENLFRELKYGTQMVQDFTDTRMLLHQNGNMVQELTTK